MLNEAKWAAEDEDARMPSSRMLRPGIGKPGSTRPFHPGLILELEAKPWAKKRSPPNDNKEDS